MKKLAYLYIFLFFAMAFSCVANAQCPPSSWSLDITVNPDQYPEETTWHLVTFSGDTLLEGGPYTNIVDYEPQYAGICVPVDSFLFILNDQYGDGVAGSLWGGNDGSVYIEQCGDTIWTLPLADFGYQIFDTIYTSGCPPPPPVFGCMDSSYVEFDLAATADTGMCFTPKVYGCTDSLAYNYIDSANTDINIDSCMHELELTDLAGNGWAGSTLKLSQATSMLPPFNYQVIGTYTLLDGFDTTFFINLAAGYPVKAVFEITQQSDFTAVQCGYSLYSEDYVAIDIEGGFVNPIPPFFPITGEPYCGNNCVERVYGCTDVSALNYNALANTDDGDCYYVLGCTNPIYLEYNANADYDDGSCNTLVVLGCMDSTAFNFDPTANVELAGSCIPTVLGCMNEFAFNYNPLANTPDTCIAIVEGCMDPAAMNYDSLANVSDNSCVYYAYGCTDPTAFNYDPLANTDDGSCIEIIYGCMDATMFNFNPDANTDNGSCIPFYYGCMDSTALNYDDNANADNGSCVYAIYGCNDPTAINYDPLVNTPDSTCEYSAGCAVGDVYTLPNDCFTWVIEVDPYCCDTEWDGTCVSLYEYCQDGWSGPTNLIELRDDLLIYPNPTSDYINISKKVDVQLFNMLGKLIISKDNISSLDVSKITPGMYNAVIYYNNIKINKRIIKK
jgi:hypothetical protein